MTVLAPEPDFDHLVAMTDARGTFEHALFSAPRPEHGYCTDDMARVLVVAVRQPDPTPAVEMLVDVSLRFLGRAIGADGRCRNRMDRAGEWEDHPSLDDCWGRALFALGTAVARSDDTDVGRTAMDLFELARQPRSPWLRAMAFAALGAAEVLSVEPTHAGAMALLCDAADSMPTRAGAAWPWPEPRLTYANAVLPEAMIAAGSALRRPELLRRGLDLLAWLLEHETATGGHLSVTPVGGSGPGDVGPRFDQQPIEVAAMADACARAAGVDGSAEWHSGVARAVAWFLGDNDAAAIMWDPLTGGGFDGLEAGGANLNQGTESTLALLATLQHARSFETVSA